MALKSGHEEIKQAQIRDGFADLNLSISQLEGVIDDGVLEKSFPQLPENIPSFMGNYLALLSNLNNEDKLVQGDMDYRIGLLYASLAAAPYKGLHIDFKVYAMNQKNDFEKMMIEDLDESDEFNLCKGQILWIEINHKRSGLFVPSLKCFMLAPELEGLFIGEDYVKPHELITYLKLNKKIAKRYYAIISTLVGVGAGRENTGNKHVRNDNDTEGVFDRLLSKLRTNGIYDADNFSRTLCEAEIAVKLDSSVISFFEISANGFTPGILCGYLGERKATENKLLDDIVLIQVDADSDEDLTYNYGTKLINKGVVVIPPVRDIENKDNLDFNYKCGTRIAIKRGESELFMPEWIEVTIAEKEINKANKIIAHKVYHVPHGGWRTCRPNNAIDLSYKVPTKLLAKYNYMFKETNVMSHGYDSVLAEWKAYPNDEMQKSCELNLIGDENETWIVVQRSIPISRLDLCESTEEDDGEKIIGCVFTDLVTEVKKSSGQIKMVSIDPASSSPVRLIKTTGDQHRGDGLDASCLIHAITPMSQKTLEKYILEFTWSGYHKKEKTHFESMTQLFNEQGSHGYVENLGAKGRIWTPEEQVFFKELHGNPGTKKEILTKIGVVCDPKRELAERALQPMANLGRFETALKIYISSLMLESIEVLAQEGFTPGNKNLKFLLSYPENESGEGVTFAVKDIIEGAASMVNRYLKGDNIIKNGDNMFVYSEGAAVGAFHKKYPPISGFDNAKVTLTIDIGNSTTDYILRSENNVRVGSVPYAGFKITTSTLAQVYGHNAEGLVKCFDCKSSLMDDAIESIKLAEKSNANGGKLQEKMGFVLALEHMFAQNIKFTVNDELADEYKRHVQQFTEMKLNILVPAFAHAISDAIDKQDIELNDDIMVAPVGKGSLAINNTVVSGDRTNTYARRFDIRLRDEIHHMSGKDYKGKITLLPNNDEKKRSVAEGLMGLYEDEAKGENFEVVDKKDPLEDYLDVIYSSDDSSEKRDRLEIINNYKADKDRGKGVDYQEARVKVFHDAFEKIVKDYKIEDFKDSFRRFVAIGGDGILDHQVLRFIEEHFEDVRTHVKKNSEQIVMHSPGLEQEMICGAMVDYCLDNLISVNNGGDISVG